MTTSVSSAPESLEELKHLLHAQALNGGPRYLYFTDARANSYVVWFSDPEVYNHGLNAPLYANTDNSPRWDSLFCWHRHEGVELSEHPQPPLVLGDPGDYVEPSLAASLRQELEEDLGPLGVILPPDAHLYYGGERLDLTGAHVQMDEDELVFTKVDRTVRIRVPAESADYIRYQVIKVIHAYLRAVL